MLQNSCEQFDAGFELAYKQIAVILRTLLHDTKMSHSLLGQLGWKDHIAWRDSNPVLPPGAHMVGFGLCSLRMQIEAEHTDFGHQARDPETIMSMGHEANNFHDWWSSSAFKDSTGHEFSRRNLVLAVSNKDGGAHIDELPSAFRALSSEGSMGWRVGVGDAMAPFVVSPVPASIRTVAEELLLSVYQSGVLS